MIFHILLFHTGYTWIYTLSHSITIDDLKIDLDQIQASRHTALWKAAYLFKQF